MPAGDLRGFLQPFEANNELQRVLGVDWKIEIGTIALGSAILGVLLSPVKPTAGTTIFLWLSVPARRSGLPL